MEFCFVNRWKIKGSPNHVKRSFALINISWEEWAENLEWRVSIEIFNFEFNIYK